MQALAAGDGLQLALIAVGDAVRPADLGGIGLRAGECWADAAGGAILLHTGRTELTVQIHTGSGHCGVCFTASGAQGVATRTLPALGASHPRPAGAQPGHLLAVIPHGTPGITAAGGAAAPAVCDDATEVPETGLAPVALEAPHARAAGALAGGWVTGAAVGAMGIALAGTRAAS